MYGAHVLMRSASAAARSLAWGTDDIAVLGGQALVRVLDHCKRAVRAGAVKFQRTAGLENARGGDLRPMVFHPIRHVHENVVLVASGEVLDRFRSRLDLVAELDLRLPGLQIEAEINGNEFGSSTLETTLASTSNQALPALPLMIVSRASRCSGVVLSERYGWKVPLPRCSGPGQ